MSVAKSTVYVETTVIGHLVGRTMSDLVVAARQVVTREWWETAADRHRICLSQLVIEECSAGDPVAASERLDLLKSLEILGYASEVDALADRLMKASAIPESEPRDALHVAYAAYHDMRFLATWNFKHIANPTKRKAIETVCKEFGFEPPIICTPEQLSEIRHDLRSDQ